MTRFLSALGAVALWVCWTGTAVATPITVQFGGFITSVDPLLAGTFAIGDPVSDTLTYDTAAADTVPGPTIGNYPYDSFQIRFGSYVATFPPGANSVVHVFNQSLVDFFQAASFLGAVGAPVNGLTLVSGSAALTDS